MDMDNSVHPSVLMMLNFVKVTYLEHELQLIESVIKSWNFLCNWDQSHYGMLCFIMNRFQIL